MANRDPAALRAVAAGKPAALAALTANDATALTTGGAAVLATADADVLDNMRVRIGEIAAVLDSYGMVTGTPDSNSLKELAAGRSRPQAALTTADATALTTAGGTDLQTTDADVIDNMRARVLEIEARLTSHGVLAGSSVPSSLRATAAGKPGPGATLTAADATAVSTGGSDDLRTADSDVIDAVRTRIGDLETRLEAMGMLPES